MEQLPEVYLFLKRIQNGYAGFDKAGQLCVSENTSFDKTDICIYCLDFADGPGDYHSCDGVNLKNMTFPDTSNFWIHAKVQGSFRETKNRGPYNENLCLRIHGNVGDWFVVSAKSECVY
ncbi:hypothetical protein C1646_663892 [Rhizophagus diaphanus]|nr:hypothetical protein C1646_663892 [Rhizophagus diaphanus] [Rhizophagus sp. MUCL 43196]